MSENLYIDDSTDLIHISQDVKSVEFIRDHARETIGKSVQSLQEFCYKLQSN